MDMDFLRQTDVIQWKDGEYKTIKENSVDDEYTYLFIDYLPPRKFSTYPKDLEDFAIGYCLGEGLIKDYSDIDSINLDGTNVLVSTKLSHDPEEDLEQEGIVQERKGNCEHACVCRLLEYQGVNSDNAGGIRSELKTIDPIKSDLTIDATQIIKDIEHLTDEAKVWKKTAGVHVAQLKYEDKIIIREDVSRHVAVDKVIGSIRSSELLQRRGMTFPDATFHTVEGCLPTCLLRLSGSEFLSSFPMRLPLPPELMLQDWETSQWSVLFAIIASPFSLLPKELIWKVSYTKIFI